MKFDQRFKELLEAKKLPDKKTSPGDKDKKDKKDKKGTKYKKLYDPEKSFRGDSLLDDSVKIK